MLIVNVSQVYMIEAAIVSVVQTVNIHLSNNMVSQYMINSEFNFDYASYKMYDKSNERPVKPELSIVLFDGNMISFVDERHLSAE